MIATFHDEKDDDDHHMTSHTRSYDPMSYVNTTYHAYILDAPIWILHRRATTTMTATTTTAMMQQQHEMLLQSIFMMIDCNSNINHFLIPSFKREQKYRSRAL
jgi:hypothetical protein